MAMTGVTALKIRRQPPAEKRQSDGDQKAITPKDLGTEYPTAEVPPPAPAAYQPGQFWRRRDAPLVDRYGNLEEVYPLADLSDWLNFQHLELHRDDRIVRDAIQTLQTIINGHTEDYYHMRFHIDETGCVDSVHLQFLLNELFQGSAGVKEQIWNSLAEQRMPQLNPVAALPAALGPCKPAAAPAKQLYHLKNLLDWMKQPQNATHLRETVEVVRIATSQGGTGKTKVSPAEFVEGIMNNTTAFDVTYRTYSTFNRARVERGTMQAILMRILKETQTIHESQRSKADKFLDTVIRWQ